MEKREFNATQSTSKNSLSLLCEVKNSGEEENIFFINGYLQRITNDERLYYNACPGDRCGRKVIEDSTGFHCENCQKTYPTCNPTYMMNARLSDFTDSLFVNFARENGTALIGMSAPELKKMRETKSEEEQTEFFDTLNFKEVNVMVKGKPDFYNGEQRMKYYAIKVLPPSVGQQNKALLSRLETYASQ